MSTSVFVDYDGTITDRDTLDVLVRRLAGDGPWRAIEAELSRGEVTLRDALARQAAFVRCTLDEADAMLQAVTRFDPSFAAFAAACDARSIPLTVVSSGIAPLIRRALERNGVGHVPVVANDVEPLPEGWRLHFRDPSPNGTDKLAVVQRAQERGDTAVYIGDGISDFDAARAADVRFAKAHRSLARHLAAAQLDYVTFEHFAEIDLAALRAA